MSLPLLTATATVMMFLRPEGCRQSRLALRFGVALLLCACAGSAASAESLQTVSRQDLSGTVAKMQALVAACKASASACNAADVAEDVQVGAPDQAGSFAVHWEWLRQALKDADTKNAAKNAERVALMDKAATRLTEFNSELGGAPANNFMQARSEANAILARAEFQRTEKVSLWDRTVARFWHWVGRVFDGMAGLGAKTPWLGGLLEWGLFLAAAVGLVIFVFRSLSQQRLRVALSDGVALNTAWSRESDDWAKLAETNAAAGDWREAVHSLYWAAIVFLEARRAWRHNPARTPREYVRLLAPGSPQQTALRGLTQTLERVWYGFGEADAAEYQRARALFDGLAAQRNSERTSAEAA